MLWSLAIEEQFISRSLGWRRVCRTPRSFAYFRGSLWRRRSPPAATMLVFPANERIQYLLTPCCVDVVALGCLLAVAARSSWFVQSSRQSDALHSARRFCSASYCSRRVGTGLAHSDAPSAIRWSRSAPPCCFLDDVQSGPTRGCGSSHRNADVRGEDLLRPSSAASRVRCRGPAGLRATGLGSNGRRHTASDGSMRCRRDGCDGIVVRVPVADQSHERAVCSCYIHFETRSRLRGRRFLVRACRWPWNKCSDLAYSGKWDSADAGSHRSTGSTSRAKHRPCPCQSSPLLPP